MSFIFSLIGILFILLLALGMILATNKDYCKAPFHPSDLKLAIELVNRGGNKNILKLVMRIVPLEEILDAIQTKKISALVAHELIKIKQEDEHPYIKFLRKLYIL